MTSCSKESPKSVTSQCMALSRPKVYQIIFDSQGSQNSAPDTPKCTWPELEVNGDIILAMLQIWHTGGFAGQSLWWHWWRKAHSSWAVWYRWKSNNRGFSPKWIVKIVENSIKMDDLGVPLFSETPIWYASSHQISLRSKVKTSQGQGAEATQHGCWGWIWPSAVSLYQFLTIQPQMLRVQRSNGLTILGDRFRPKSIDQLCSPQNLQQSLSSRQLPWSNLTSLETNSFTLQCLRFRKSTVTSTARPPFPFKAFLAVSWNSVSGIITGDLISHRFQPCKHEKNPGHHRSHWR